ncbi:hypothetical protein [Fervidobacterium thailandense]|uniref:Fibronectin type III domain-containing protein n=1 Tax=Fervidobacterium thailandense TaxID=1008305 RepID=A0A1E3G3M2_9BACT|nr:hypothetical protein [Fervidobacterium thailandense]ODN30799.1 hypothetical protein A4H02_02695 [Fervidobacterium thailandense]
MRSPLRVLWLIISLIIIILHIQGCSKPKVTLLTPKNGAKNLPLELKLSWQFSKNPKDYTFEVFIGEGEKLTPYTKITGQTFVDVSDLHPATAYNWKVIAISKNKRKYESDVWSFKTTNAPLKPSSPTPQDGETLTETPTLLTWSCEDPDGDKLSFDVYFGEMGSMQLVASGVQKTEFVLDPRTLKTGVTYYWQVVARDDKLAQTDGPIWSFTIIESEATGTLNENPH